MNLKQAGRKTGRSITHETVDYFDDCFVDLTHFVVRNIIIAPAL